MKHLLRKLSIITAIAGTALIGIGLLCYVIGARINTSKSIPLGLYWISDKPVGKGDYVLLCPPQVGVIAEARRRGYLAPGFCPGGHGYMMKKLVAAKEDAVTITDAGVTVNGVLQPLSKPLMADRAGRAMPRYQSTSFVMGNSEVLLMSDVSGTSFDSRYFGPINRYQILTTIVPVITW
jgi:conjugative transfer signal peptidase TraF